MAVVRRGGGVDSPRRRCDTLSSLTLPPAPHTGGRPAPPPPPSPPLQADASTPITAIGVEQFVLVEAASGRAVLTLRIPEAALALTAADRVRGDGAELAVTCTPPDGDAFTITLHASG